MHNNNELTALREYSQTLERQNEAKTIEQQTLYRELEALEKELKSMDRYYHQNKQLNQEIEKLRSVISFQAMALGEADQKFQEINFLREENLALQDHLNINNQKIYTLEHLSENLSHKIKRLEQELLALQHQNSQLQNKRDQILTALEEKQEENHSLKQKIYELSQEQSNQAQKNLQELAENYEKIELVVLQKEEMIQEMESYINQLEHQCQFLNQEYIKSENYNKKLEHQIKSLQMKRSPHRVPEDNLSFLTDSISKVDLMRQNNRMLERIIKYEKENDNDNTSQRFSYSECGEPKKSNSPSKLQMRIHTLKMENQSLLRTLAI